MAIEQPLATDKQSHPDHSLSHRVFANDDSSPAQSIIVNSAGNVAIAGNISANNIAPMANRITVGPDCSYETLADAVTWFNASATSDTEILIVGGHFPVSETIHIHNVNSKSLNIRGFATGVTFLEAATGLEGTPMFDLVTPCDFRQMTCTGSTLTGHGDSAGEDFINLSTTVGLYSEIVDIFIDTFMVAINDTIGSDIFVFNFAISDCQTGIVTNYTTNSPTSTVTLDAEIGNFVHCRVGVDLVKTGADKKSNFFLNGIIFKHNADTQIGVRYTGGDYTYGEIANIINCTYNNRGEFVSGFNFTNARDANIVVKNNVGEEDNKPHAKINVYNSAAGTTITTGGVFYKAGFTNGPVYTTKMTLTDNRMLYQSKYSADGMMWLSGAIAVDHNGRNLDIALRREISVVSVSGNSTVATVTTTAPHRLENGSQVQMLGWNSATFNGIKTVTVVSNTVFTYPIGVTATPTGGTCGRILSPTTVRAITSGVIYPFSLNAYLEDTALNDYYEIFVTSQSNGDVITLSDVSWLYSAV